MKWYRGTTEINEEVAQGQALTTKAEVMGREREKETRREREEMYEQL